LHDPLPAGAVARLGTGRFRHGANINGVAYSPDGKALATSSLDNTLRVWDAATGQELRRFGRMNADHFVAQLFCVAFSPDGKTVAAAGNAQRIFVYDRLTGAELHQLASGDQPIQALAFSPDGKVLASAGWDHSVSLWDVTAGSELRRLEGHEDRVTSVAFAPGGKRLLSGGVDHTVRVWDPETGRELRRLDGPTKPVLCVAVSPDGKWMAAGGGDGVAFLWDAATGKEVRRLRTDLDDGWVLRLAFSPDSGSLAAAWGHRGPDRDHMEGRALLWDVQTGKILRTFAAGHLVFESVAFAPDGKTVAAVGGHDSTVHRWEAATGKELRPAGGHEGPVGSIAFTADGRALLTAGGDEAVCSWDGGGRIRWQAPGGAVWVGADGRALLLMDGRGAPAVQARDVETGREGPRFALHAGDRAAALSPDGRTLASAGDDGVIRLWDVAAGTERRRLTGPRGRIRLLTFSPDGKLLASDGQDQSCRLWDVATGKELRQFPGAAHALDFSPDGKLLAWAGYDRTGQQVWGLRLYDPATGKEVRDLTTYTGPDKFQQAQDAVMAVRFSPDGRTLAAGTQGNEVVLWEVATGRQRASLRGHQGWIGALAFAPDGNRLASGSSDTATLVWDLRGGTAPAVPPSEEMLKDLWAVLADADTARAYAAMQSLTSSPGASGPLLQRQLRPVPRVDADRLARLIADLDSERFEARDRAATELEKLGDAVELALRGALKKNPPAEVRRRLERLLDGLDARAASGDGLRTLRAVEVLERIGTPEARAVLRQVADGAPDARLTAEARTSLQRLDRSPGK
jgi:WD40 repeat protein